MDDEIKKEMLLRMVIRCNKCKKHKPKKVKDPSLTVDRLESELFSEELKRYYTWSEVREVKRNLQNIIIRAKK